MYARFLRAASTYQAMIEQTLFLCNENAPFIAEMHLNSLPCVFQIFGEQIYYGSPYDRPEVLDFPTYAACRFLDTSPENPVST